MVFQIDEVSVPHTSSNTATESTYSFFSLIAKANYQFLRQAIIDQAGIYAGSGWVDAVLDQRESGLRDVRLSVSTSQSALSSECMTSEIQSGYRFIIQDQGYVSACHCCYSHNVLSTVHRYKCRYVVPI